MSGRSTYFIDKLKGPPNGKYLQELCLFNIIYYGICRGCENLRSMTKKSFEIKEDFDGRCYLEQVIKECDKNHKEDNYGENNEA